MTGRALTTSTLIFLLFVSPILLFAQAPGDWANVKALPAGMNVRVESKSGRKIEGSIKTVSDTEIAVATKTASETLARNEVKKIYELSPGSRGKWAAIGAVVGAGIGAVLGLALLGATGGSDNSSAVVAPIIAVGAGVGGGLGAAFPMKKRTLVFESK